MNQGLCAQVLTGKHQHEFKQASGAKNIMFQNATDLQHIPLTEPLERDYYQALKKSITKCNRLATYFMSTNKK